MKPKSRLQEIVENNPIYQQLDAANQQPGRLRPVKLLRHYEHGHSGNDRKPYALTDVVISYAFGLVGMLLLAIIIAASFNYRLLFGLQQTSFEAMPTGLVITLLYPLILLIFLFIAYVSKTWTFVIYPFAMLALTGLFADNSFIHWVAGWLPFSDVTDNGSPVFSLYAFVAVTAMIMLVYCIERPVRGLADKRAPRRVSLLHRSLLIGVIITVAAASVFGQPLRQAVLHDRATVHLPNTATVSAFNPDETGFRLAYVQPRSITEINYDTLRVSAVQDWWHRDIQTVCGASAAAGLNQLSYDYAYRTTDSGLPYAVASTEGSEYVCFVVGYQRYDIARDTASYRYGKYRTASVVTQVAQAPRYVLFCDDTRTLPQPSRAQRQTAEAACRPADAAAYAIAARSPGVVVNKQ